MILRTDDGGLILGGIVYPYHPETQEPWTDASIEAYLAVDPAEEAAAKVRMDETAAKVAEAAAKAPIWVSKANALRLLTPQELAGLNLARRKVAALVVADYTSTDPEKKGLVALETFLTVFDAAVDVNLKDAGLAQGMGLLKTLGVIATDERVAAILSNTPPA